MIVEHGEHEDVEQAKQKAIELIADHPLTSVGGAFAIGAVLGLLGSGKRGGAVSAAIGGIVMALIRDAVVRKVSGYANHWIDVKSREEAVSRQREAGAFLEH